ncbi:hypothetical protein CC1G_04422 [Coprinopsis cinerea okayama7|uniref:Secreted protein n=1 Tax=Coprinopsis cinerea (strain Okayama-7 / 130 / ATCC MYA-4618 / FGSC 9003) TaxID=240176 RepID=A8N0K1_COPC7|nr:hypothetical protein CC1G_04422 [Coprinopsis cinerea okayama7\|eukprot:XP_001828451.2 hypothetical protein CC1G_04422 [Coprinopsis cinerea okayama7\
MAGRVVTSVVVASALLQTVAALPCIGCGPGVRSAPGPSGSGSPTYAINPALVSPKPGPTFAVPDHLRPGYVYHGPPGSRPKGLSKPRGSYRPRELTFGDEDDLVARQGGWKSKLKQFVPKNEDQMKAATGKFFQGWRAAKNLYKSGKSAYRTYKGIKNSIRPRDLELVDDLTAREFDLEEFEARDLFDMDDIEARDFSTLEDIEARDFEDVEARGYEGFDDIDARELAHAIVADEVFSRDFDDVYETREFDGFMDDLD